MSTRHHAHRTAEVLKNIAAFEKNNGNLPGLTTVQRRETWTAQIISSLRRIEFVTLLLSQTIDPVRGDPQSPLFDPIKAAALNGKNGATDEAVWLAFVATHFGKHAIDAWKLAANVMGSFGVGPTWTVGQYTSAPAQFDNMLVSNATKLLDPKQSGRFSNHRQYQSKKAATISAVFQSFHDWQFKDGNFVKKVQAIHKTHGQNPTVVFDQLYRSLDDVYGFGRLGKFDLLTMLGKLQLAPIVAGSVYMVGATGPMAGAKLLFHNNRTHNVSPVKLGADVDSLDAYLNVGKQVLEDSLCNWQKSPETYVYFKG
jgi:hypothetical protein